MTDEFHPKHVFEAAKPPPGLDLNQKDYIGLTNEEENFVSTYPDVVISNV